MKNYLLALSLLGLVGCGDAGPKPYSCKFTHVYQGVSLGFEFSVYPAEEDPGNGAEYIKTTTTNCSVTDFNGKFDSSTFEFFEDSDQNNAYNTAICRLPSELAGEGLFDSPPYEPIHKFFIESWGDSLVLKSTSEGGDGVIATISKEGLCQDL